MDEGTRILLLLLLLLAEGRQVWVVSCVAGMVDILGLRWRQWLLLLLWWWWWCWWWWLGLLWLAALILASEFRRAATVS